MLREKMDLLMEACHNLIVNKDLNGGVIVGQDFEAMRKAYFDIKRFEKVEVAIFSANDVVAYLEHVVMTIDVPQAVKDEAADRIRTWNRHREEMIKVM